MDIGQVVTAGYISQIYNLHKLDYENGFYEKFENSFTMRPISSLIIYILRIKTYFTTKNFYRYIETNAIKLFFRS